MITTFNLATRLGTDLSSRHLGAILRDEACEAISQGSIAAFDFAGVRTVSDSFSDELLATLVELRGHDWFRQNVRLVNLSASVRTSILEAISNRLSVCQ